MRARWHMGRYNKTDAGEALRLFREVIDRDPRNAEAHAWLAILDVARASYGWAEDPRAATRDAIDAAKRAASLDGLDALVLVASGVTMTLERRYERGVETCMRAIRQNPNLALAHASLAGLLGLSGQYDRACEALEAARRLSPLDPELTMMLAAVSLGAFAEGRYEDVLRICERAISENPDVPAFHRQKAAALVMLDRTDEARQTVDQLLSLVPNYTIGWVRDYLSVPESTMTPLVEALRKAGLPE